MSRSPLPPPPGFFGKVPARGDFLARRPVAGFQQRWEGWLGGFVAAARGALGEGWPHDWLTAPLWHFSLGVDVGPPGGAAGVLVASVDRVGRFFPFSILGAFSTLPAVDRAASDAWAGRVEALALAALEDDFDPDALDQALRDLGGPPALSGVAGATGCWPLALDGDWPALTAEARDACWQPPGPDQSAWWCRGSERMGPSHLRCRGLPDAAVSAAMVSGAFCRPGTGRPLTPGSAADWLRVSRLGAGACPERASPIVGRSAQGKSGEASKARSFAPRPHQRRRL